MECVDGGEEEDRNRHHFLVVGVRMLVVCLGFGAVWFGPGETIRRIGCGRGGVVGVGEGGMGEDEY